MLTSSSGLSILFFCTFLLNKIQSVHLNLIQVLWTLALSYGELPFTQHSICTSTHLYISQVYNNHILPTHKLTTTQIKPILYNPTLKNQNVTTTQIYNHCEQIIFCGPVSTTLSLQLLIYTTPFVHPFCTISLHLRFKQAKPKLLVCLT